MVKSEFDGIHVRCNNHASIGLFQAGKFGRPCKRKMQLRDKAVTTQTSNSIGETDVEMLNADQNALAASRLYAECELT